MVRETGWTLTSYCACKSCCGKEDKITASGHKLTDADHLRVCAAPSGIKFNTTLTVSGGWDGDVKVVDRGGAIQGKKLDIYCKTHELAKQFGVKTNCTIEY